MKYNDKIYLPSRFNLIDGLRVRESDSDVEYIRKDTILEWANNMKRICKGAEPIEKAYQTMIDKLNEM